MLRIAFLTIACLSIAATTNGQTLLFEEIPATPERTSAIANWSHLQAVGEPNTTAAGDIPTAWASAGQDTGDEWLELTYEKEVEVKEVHVYETYNTGALFKVTGYKKSGMEVPLWTGEDPTPVGAGKGVSKVKLKTPLKTNRIRIHLHSKEVAGWNEIDAVGVIDTDEKTHWAVDASASSTYGAGGLSSTFLPDPRDEKIKELEAALEELQALLKASEIENDRLNKLLKEKRR